MSGQKDGAPNWVVSVLGWAFLYFCGADRANMIRNSERKKAVRTTRRLNKTGESLSSRAYQQIRNEILRGDLSIGDVLSRRGLAKKYNMSFLPITEALKCLETEGLVESRPRIGTRVRVPSEQDIRDSFVIREALESQAARLCAQNITEEEKQQLRTNARHLDELQKTSVLEPADSRFLFSVHTYHVQFHMRIAELSRCPGLCHAIEKEHVLVFNWVYDIAANRRTQPEEFHSALANALCSGDPLVADTAMRAHVRYGLDQVLERLTTYDKEDAWRLKSKSSEESGKKSGRAIAKRAI
jgi:GntR family transcriptional regulator, rspAB operon transcriptional repressor